MWLSWPTITFRGSPATLWICGALAETPRQAFAMDNARWYRKGCCEVVAATDVTDERCNCCRAIGS